MIRVGSELLVEENAVARLARLLLKWQRNQIAEPASGQSVLVGKEPVIRIKPKFRPAFHGFCNQIGAEVPCYTRGDRFREEQPNVTARSRARALQRSRKSQPLTSLVKCAGVLLPAIAIEIDSQEVAGLVRKHRVEANNEVTAQTVEASEMLPDDLVRDRKKTPVGTLGTFDSGLLANTADPFVGASRCIPGLASFPAYEPARIDVLTPAKQGAEQDDLLSGCRVLSDLSISRVSAEAWSRRGKLSRKGNRSHDCSLS